MCWKDSTALRIRFGRAFQTRPRIWYRNYLTGKQIAVLQLKKPTIILGSNSKKIKNLQTSKFQQTFSQTWRHTWTQFSSRGLLSASSPLGFLKTKLRHLDKPLAKWIRMETVNWPLMSWEKDWLRSQRSSCHKRTSLKQWVWSIQIRMVLSITQNSSLPASRAITTFRKTTCALPSPTLTRTTAVRSARKSFVYAFKVTISL